MKLYFYNKSKNHKSADTDVLILTSVEAFCNENNVPPYNGRVFRTDMGKPYLENNCLYIGVTHTDNIVIVGISSENFGIDCEAKDRMSKNPEGVMKRFFAENEREYILKSHNKDKAFIETWVKKEAYVKYTGEGISGLSRCDTTAMSGFEKIENNKNLIIYIYKETTNE